MIILRFILITFFLSYIFFIKRNLRLKLPKFTGVLLAYALIIVSIIDEKYIFNSISLVLILYSIIIGYLTYVIALIIVGVKFNINTLFPYKLIYLKKQKLKIRKELLVNLYTSLFEELLFRGALLTSFEIIFNNIYLVIFIVSLIFMASHYSQKKALIQLIELFVFSIILCSLFCYHKNLWVVVIVHIIRNTFQICNKYYYLYINMSIPKQRGAVPINRKLHG